MESEVKSIFMETLRFANLGIIHAKNFKYDSSWFVNSALNTHEIYFIYNGEMHLSINGDSFVLGENQMVLIPANTYKDMYISKNKTAAFFSAQFTAESSGRSYFNYVPMCPVVDASENRGEILRLADAMNKIGEPMSHTEVFRRIGLLGELIGIYMDIASPGVNIEKTHGKIDFQKAITHINRFYRYEHITVQQLAGIMRISESHFRREFKKQYGISCKMYINSLRMNGVLKMLRDSDATLSSIAENFRYSTESYLSREVKKATGMSPTEYRKKYKK